MDKAANDNASVRPSPEKPCAICGKPATVAMAPFCSKRCADVDLHRWLGEGYRVPVRSDHDDEVGLPSED